MREACARAVANAMNLEATPARLADIETRISRAMRGRAGKTPEEWRSLTEEQRYAEAGKRAGLELAQEELKKEQRAEATVVRYDRLQNWITKQVTDGSDENPVDAHFRILVHNYDEKNGGFISIEDQIQAGFNVDYARVSGVFDTLNSGLWNRILKGIWTTEPLRRAMTNALHGVTKDVPKEILKAAEQFHEIVNERLEYYNSVGGNVGRLEDWGSTHTWSERLAARYKGKWRDDLEMTRLRLAGDRKGQVALAHRMEEKARTEFAEFMSKSAQRERYTHEDGTTYTPEEMVRFFEEAHGTILSDGQSKADPAVYPGGSIKANRGSQHRVIHLRPEAVYEALQRYSEQNILESMLGTLKRMNRDIALVETIAPNADYIFEQSLSKAVTEASAIHKTKTAEYQAAARRARYLYNHIAGNNPKPASRSVSDAFATMRNFNVFKLGSSAITAITDFVPMYQTAFQNRLNPLQVMLNSTLAWAPKSRRYARRLGLVVETMISDLERVSGENISARTLSAKTASGVIRASGLSFMTNARRLGFSMTMLDAIGHLTRQYDNVSALHDNDYAILASKGIDRETWDIWRAARIDNWGVNHTILTPEAIMAVSDAEVAQIVGVSHSLDGGGNMPASEAKFALMEARRRAAIRLLSIVNNEQDLAILTPGAKEQVTARTFFGATDPGTIGGEIARSMFMFKSFSLALMGRQGERAGFYHQNWKGRYAYMGQLFIMMTLLGVVSLWLRNLSQGQNLRQFFGDMSDPEQRSIITRNWLHAAMAGGGLGVLGDFLFRESSPYSQATAGETIMGPTLSTGFGALNLVTGNLQEIGEGEDPEIGSDILRFARQQAPFTNLPYTRALADRAIYNALSEEIDPGAVDRLRERQQRTQGTTYWWDPANLTPESAPDLSTATRPN